MAKAGDIAFIHPDFKLDKKHLDLEKLSSLAGLFVKKGEAHEVEIGNFLQDWLDKRDFVRMKTSGSTGPPKTIKVKKEHLVNSALATGKFFDLPSKTTALLCLPASYVAGKMMLVRAMVLGWHLDTVPPKANPLDQVFKRYDFCAMTPFQLDNSLNRLHLLKKLIVGGGSISMHLKNMVQGTKAKIYETYGMTETVSHIAAMRINPKKPKNHVWAFKVFPKVSISRDKRGCLVIDAPKIAENQVVTNDVVELLTYKKFLWKGRIDNVINSGGVKIHPEQVEKKFQEVLFCRFFVSSVPDQALGEKVVLFVEQDFSGEKLHGLAKKIAGLKSLDKYERPKKVYFVEKFEETATGKIDRGNTLKSRMG